MNITIIVKGSEIMKSFMLKFFKKYGGMFAALALTVTTVTAHVFGSIISQNFLKMQRVSANFNVC